MTNSLNRQLSQKDLIKALAIIGVSIVVLGSAIFALQRTQTNTAHTESLRIQALEMGHTAESGEGGPVEEEGQRSDPHFVP